MGMDGVTGVGSGRKPPAIETHDVEFHGEEGERVIPRHKNPDGHAGIFDDLLMHLYSPDSDPGS